MADYDSLLKRTSHFTYDLVASILPGFTALTAGLGFAACLYPVEASLAVDGWLTQADKMTVIAQVLTFLVLALACYVMGGVFLAVARKLKASALFKVDMGDTQQNVDAILNMSRWWSGSNLLIVENDDKKDETAEARKWIARKFAVAGDETSLVTTYHYKFHLHRSMAAIWLVYGVICFMLAIIYLLCGDCYRAAVCLVSVVGCAVLFSVKHEGYGYYMKRYWMTIALDFCIHDQNLRVKRVFDKVKLRS